MRILTLYVILAIVAMQPLHTAAQGRYKHPALSPSDSAAAMRQFSNTSGGTGMFYQFTTTYTQNGKVTLDTQSMYMTDGGNMRSDMGTGEGVYIIGSQSLPTVSVMLNRQHKTYKLNKIDTGEINQFGQQYKVARVGEETIHGYHCVHATLTIALKNMAPIVEHVWLSKDVPGYALVKKIGASENVTPDMMRALDGAGCSGFFVKLTVQSTVYTMDMELTTAERKNLSGNLFEIPSGYTSARNIY
jgi:hypothetical protein